VTDQEAKRSDELTTRLIAKSRGHIGDSIDKLTKSMSEIIDDSIGERIRNKYEPHAAPIANVRRSNSDGVFRFRTAWLADVRTLPLILFKRLPTKNARGVKDSCLPRLSTSILAFCMPMGLCPPARNVVNKNMLPPIQVAESIGISMA
jgi:hypothetical protein